MDDLREVLMSFSFEKLLSSDATLGQSADVFGQPTDWGTIPPNVFVYESEELKCSHVIRRQVWQVFGLHSLLLSINVTFNSA